MSAIGSSVKEMIGREKAAIFISSLPEDRSIKLFKLLKEHEIEKIIKTMMTIESPSKETLDFVLKEAWEYAKEISPIRVAPEYLRSILEKALPKEQLERLLEDTFSTEEGKAIFKELERLDSKQVTAAIRNEHPQVIALILSQIRPVKASEIIQLLPRREGVTNLREEVIKRIASIEKISNQTLKVVADSLEEELITLGASQGEELVGIDIAAEIVNNLPKEMAQEILEEVREEDELLADGIEERMFKFEDIAKLDDRAIMEILKVTDKNELMIALKGATEAIMNQFLSNMSKRAADMFMEDMEVLGPIRKSEVDKAARKIIDQIKTLIVQGKIDFGSGDEYV